MKTSFNYHKTYLTNETKDITFEESQQATNRIKIKPFSYFLPSIDFYEPNTNERFQDLKTITLTPYRTDIEGTEEICEFISTHFPDSFILREYDLEKLTDLVNDLRKTIPNTAISDFRLATHLSRELNRALNIEPNLSNDVLTKSKALIESHIAWDLRITDRLIEAHLSPNLSDEIATIAIKNLPDTIDSVELSDFLIEPIVYTYINTLKNYRMIPENLLEQDASTIADIAKHFLRRTNNLAKAKEKTLIAANFCLQVRTIIRESYLSIRPIVDTTIKIYERCLANDLSTRQSSTITSVALYHYIKQLQKPKTCFQNPPSWKASNIAFKLMWYYKLSKYYGTPVS